MDARTGHLLIAHAGPERSDGAFMGNGHVDVRDGRTGRLLRTITVGVAPGALAVDTRTGRLFVVNEGGNVPAVDAWSWLPAWLRRRLPLFPPSPAPTRQVPGSVSMIALTTESG